MKSIKGQLILYFGALVLSASLAIGIASFINGSHGMKDLQSQMLLNKLEGDIASARQYLYNFYGDIKLKNGEICDESGNPIEGKYDMVDAISSDLGDVATIFEVSGTDFRSISSNVMSPDNERLIGTLLETDSPAYAPLMARDTYFGQADIFGINYYTVYEPIKDKNNDMIAILFIGTPTGLSEILIKSYNKTLIKNTATITLIVLLISLAVILATANNVTVPVIKMSKLITEISQYNLNSNEDEISKLTNRKDEIGTMASSLKTLQKNLLDVISTIASTSNTVSESSTKLSSTSLESSLALEEVVKSITDIAQGHLSSRYTPTRGL